MRKGRIAAAIVVLAFVTGYLGFQPFSTGTVGAAPVVTDLGATIGGDSFGRATLSLSIAQPAVGDVVAVAITLPGVGGAIDVIDDAGNSYTSDADIVFGDVRTAIFSATITAALTATDTIRVDTPATGPPVLITAVAMTGVVRPSVDAISGATAGDPNHAEIEMNPGSPTTTVNDAVIFAAYGVAGASANPVFTPPVGFTLHQAFGQGSDQIGTAYSVVGAPGTHSAVAYFDSDDTAGSLVSAQAVAAYQSAIPPQVTDLGASAGGTAEGDTGKTLDAGADVGDVVIVALTFPDAAGDVSVTDEKGNTYEIDADVRNESLVRTVVLSTTVTTALVAGDDIQVQTPHLGGLIAVSVLAVKGITRPPVDVSTDTTIGPADHGFMDMDPGPVTTTEPGGFIFAAFGITGSAGNPVFAPAGDLTEHWSFSAGGGEHHGTAYKFPGTAGSYSGVADFDSDDDPGQHASAQALVAYGPGGPVDVTPPVTELVVDITEPIDFADPSEGPDGESGWYVSFTNVTLFPSDDLSGVIETRCMVITDGVGTVPTTYSDLPPSCGFVFQSSAGFSGGIRDIYFASIDAELNEEAVQHVQLKIDTTDPSASIALDPASPNGDNGWYVSPVLVTVSGADEAAPSSESGVAETRCITNPVTAPATFDDIPAAPCFFLGSGSPLSIEGENTVYAATKDNAGNTSSVVSATAKIDETAPVATLTPDPATPNGDNGFYTTGVNIAFGATETGSGIPGGTFPCYLVSPGAADPAPTTYDELAALSGVATCTIGVDLLLLGDGTWTIYGAAKDAAGNEGPVASLTVKIDRTAPEFTFLYDYTTGDFVVIGDDATATEVTRVDDGSIRIYTVTDAAGNETVLRVRVINAGFFAYFRMLDSQYKDGEPVDLFAWGIVWSFGNFPFTANYELVNQIVVLREPAGVRSLYALWFTQGGPGSTMVAGPGGGNFFGQTEIHISSIEGDIEHSLVHQE